MGLCRSEATPRGRGAPRSPLRTPDPARSGGTRSRSVTRRFHRDPRQSSSGIPVWWLLPGRECSHDLAATPSADGARTKANGQARALRPIRSSGHLPDPHRVDSGSVRQRRAEVGTRRDRMTSASPHGKMRARRCFRCRCGVLILSKPIHIKRSPASLGQPASQSSYCRCHEPDPRIAAIIPSANGSLSMLVVHVSAVAADPGDAAGRRSVTHDTCKP